MMRAAVVTDFSQPLEIRDVRKPDVSDGKTIVKVAACGVWHTDLHTTCGDLPVKRARPSFPARRAWASWLRSGAASLPSGRPDTQERPGAAFVVILARRGYSRQSAPPARAAFLVPECNPDRNMKYTGTR
jgi:hypothetical protein